MQPLFQHTPVQPTAQEQLCTNQNTLINTHKHKIFGTLTTHYTMVSLKQKA